MKFLWYSAMKRGNCKKSANVKGQKVKLCNEMKLLDQPFGPWRGLGKVLQFAMSLDKKYNDILLPALLQISTSLLQGGRHIISNTHAVKDKV